VPGEHFWVWVFLGSWDSDTPYFFGFTPFLVFFARLRAFISFLMQAEAGFTVPCPRCSLVTKFGIA
jgi:hypothetical protein